jgi:predicted TIM-barrel fold metal-dependent hydrolase
MARFTVACIATMLALGVHAGPELQTPPIIDMHLHADLPPMKIPAGAPSICRPEPCEATGAATADNAETLRLTLDIMRRHNIVKAFLSGRDPVVVDQWVEAARGRFIASWFMLRPGEPTPEQFRQGYKAGRIAGMGEIATQLSGISPADPALEPYFALAEEMDVPVLIHTAGIGPELPTFRSARGSPLLLEPILVKHPKLRLFVENAAYPYGDDMIAMMSQYPQLYADVSTATWVLPRKAFYQYLERLMTAGLGKRIMFGSDQMRWPGKIEAAIQTIREAPFLSADEQRDIFFNNAARFLRMAPAAEVHGQS